MSQAALPKPGQPPGEFVREYTRDGLEAGADSQNLIRTVSKMDAIAEMELAKLKRDPEGQVACRIGCDHCCHRLVSCRVSELIQIAQRVSSRFTPSQQEALRARCKQYSLVRSQFQGAELRFARPACPFLLDRQCSIYDVRPLTCRAMNSRSVAACAENRFEPAKSVPTPNDNRQNLLAVQLSEAHARAVQAKGLAHYFVDLGSALPELLEHPELIDRFFSGEAILMEHAIIAGGPDAVRELNKREAGRKAEPSGFPPQPAIPGHPVHEFLRTSLPIARGSQEDLKASLSRYRKLLRDLAETPMDAAQAFDGLSEFQTLEVPYTGENVTEILRQVGTEIVCPVVARALPDLTEPMEARKPEGRLRVGYLSAQMTGHNSATAVRGWVSNHAEDIESFVFHTGGLQDVVTLELRARADHFYYLPGDVPSTARFIKSLNLDALIYPSLGNSGKNYQYAAMRLAPVQCTTWGQPVTSGLPTIDYFLSSEIMEPEKGQEHYTERLVRLPGSGWYWMPPAIEPVQKTQAELGLPDGPFFVVAQYVNKLVPQWDFLYKEIQQATGAAIVFIEFGNEGPLRQTKQRLAQAGIKATWIPVQTPENLSRIFQLSIASLDPPAWHGGSTTVQALMAGGAVLCLPTESLRGRFGLAFLKQANVEGLIAQTPEEFIRLAADSERIRQVMRGLQSEGPLRDPAVPPAFDAFLRRVSGR